MAGAVELRDATSRLRTLTAAVDGVVGLLDGAVADRDALGGQEALEVLLGVRVQLDRLAVASSCLAVTVDADGWWALQGARSFSHWLAGASGMPFHRAREVVVTGRALRDHLPATARAALAGEIGAEQVHVLATTAPTSDARRAALAAPAQSAVRSSWWRRPRRSRPGRSGGSSGGGRQRPTPRRTSGATGTRATGST